jgi:hypothetical protein
MIEFIFTLDYEIYGNGVGSLRAMVYEPAEELRAVFKRWNARCVVFVEAAELEIIERNDADPYIGRVRDQVKDLHHEGFEIGLHLHPQWYKARWGGGQWLLNDSEYNLCILPRERIVELVDRSIGYLRSVIGVQDFTPVSFRAGNWLFQPTETIASVLAERGIFVDSSVFKGGLQRHHRLDYRAAPRNVPFWRFSNDVNINDPQGALLEIPIYTRIVPFWRMITSKRIALQRKSSKASGQDQSKSARLNDFLKFLYPLKLDFCRMTTREMLLMLDKAQREDRKNPCSLMPVVAIGHTKDLVHAGEVDTLLGYLRANDIPISCLDAVRTRCLPQEKGCF